MIDHEYNLALVTEPSHNLLDYYIAGKMNINTRPGILIYYNINIFQTQQAYKIKFRL